MAIIVAAAQPHMLLETIRKAVADHSVGTWKYRKNGDFTHTPLQWRSKAWLRPHLDAGHERLLFGIIFTREEPFTRSVYSVYHGRFIEMLIACFGNSFTSATATATPVFPDECREQG